MLKILAVELKDKWYFFVQTIKRLWFIIAMIIAFFIVGDIEQVQINSNIDWFSHTIENRYFDLIFIALFFVLKTFLTNNSNLYIHYPSFVYFGSHKTYYLPFKLIQRYISYTISRGILFYLLSQMIGVFFNHSVYLNHIFLLLFSLFVVDIFSEVIKFGCMFSMHSRFYLLKILALLIVIGSVVLEKVWVVFFAIPPLFFLFIRNINIQKFLNYSKLIYKTNVSFVKNDWSTLIMIAEEYARLFKNTETKSCELILKFPYNIFLKELLLIKRNFISQLCFLFIVIIVGVVLISYFSLNTQKYVYFIVHSIILINLLLIHSIDTKKHIYFYMHHLKNSQQIISSMVTAFINITANLMILVFVHPVLYYKIICFLILDTFLLATKRIFWQKEKLMLPIFVVVIVLQLLILHY
ncbi:hypothetical protein Calkr_1352 [Caldicellulosiruptor acetigenus I77R1B]|uniref:Uncharacterized protein n=1 Tax=Caldicellulosiruptor acetigenus (strain ATCC 700853 / DSM 12137 / I77R1B) TaxID=632335 RepID=E4S882_CALA7|nr:hypothetical protein [Caldicellulosiruptor acetigenus]ADQ40855.1 hypothetical protein Calkr_1352 [Caldicellulosiruptor acetigenus I77R1B]